MTSRYPIRVMQLISGFAIGEQSGGAEKFALQLAIHLDGRIFTRGVFGLWQFNSASEKNWQNRLQHAGVIGETLVTPQGLLTTDLRRAWQSAWQAVDRFKPDIINSHSERGDTLNGLLHWLHPLHPLAIRTMHTDKQWQTQPWLGRVISQGIFPATFGAEMAISKAVQQVLDERPFARALHKRSYLCYNGIESSLFNHPRRSEPALLLPPGIPAVPVRLGIVGRLTPQKGHIDLLRALTIVHSRFAAHLFVIGRGLLEGQLRSETTRLGLDGYVHFLDSRSDVYDILPCLTALVSPSLWEGFPTVVLEAMALGVPVIATDVSGSRELIKPGVTGWLVPPAAPDHLAEAIINLLEHRPEAKIIGQNAQSAARQFTIEKTAGCYSQIYQHVLEK